MAKRLNLDVTEVKMIEQNLQKKYADFFGKNEEKYKKFDSMIFQMYRTKIFNVDLDMDISLFVDPEEKTLQ